MYYGLTGEDLKILGALFQQIVATEKNLACNLSKLIFEANWKLEVNSENKYTKGNSSSQVAQLWGQSLCSAVGVPSRPLGVFHTLPHPGLLVLVHHQALVPREELVVLLRLAQAVGSPRQLPVTP